VRGIFSWMALLLSTYQSILARMTARGTPGNATRRAQRKLSIVNLVNLPLGAAGGGRRHELCPA